MSLEQNILIGDIPVASSNIGVGTYHLHDKINPAEAIAAFEEAAMQGAVLFETSDNYGAELTIGKALEYGFLNRDKVIIATKTGLGTSMQEQRDWSMHGRGHDTSVERILHQIDASLMLLGVDTIDLYQLHVPDEEVPHARHAEAMEVLRQAGKIREYGLSNYTPEQVREFLAICDEEGFRRPATIQPYANIIGPEALRHVELAMAEDLVMLAHSPLLKGALTDTGHTRVREEIDAALKDELSPESRKVVESMAQYSDVISDAKMYARSAGYSLQQFAIAALASLPQVVVLTTLTNGGYLAEAVEASTWDVRHDSAGQEMLERLGTHLYADLYAHKMQGVMRAVRGY